MTSLPPKQSCPPVRHGDTLPPVPRSVVHMLADAALGHPDRTAVVFEGRALTYRQYASAVAGLAARWRPSVAPGDRIALILPNSMDLAIGIYAAHALRCQVLCLNPAYRARELEGILRDAQPALLVHDDQLPHDFTAMAALAPERRIAIPAGSAFADLADEGILLADGLPDHDDLATLQYTSGTSGKPKGVDIAHRQLAWNVAQREALLPTRRAAETVLCVMPLYHVSAVAMSLHLACHASATLVIHRRFDAGETLAAISTQSISVLSGVPTIFRALLAHPALARTDFSSLAHCYSGAAPLPISLLQHWETVTGCPIMEGYGLSEGGPCLTYNPERGMRKPGSVGIPVPGSDLDIVDAAGNVMTSPGSEGEIRVRGPHVMAGYRNQPELTRDRLRDGWLYTGDVGFKDEDGYVYVKGRGHDSINVGGYTVHPREIEEVLLLHPGVAQAAAFAVDDAYYGQKPHAWVVPRPGARLEPAELLAHCKANLVHYKVPRAVGLAATLPVNTTGKLLRHQLTPVPVQAPPEP